MVDISHANGKVHSYGVVLVLLLGYGECTAIQKCPDLMWFLVAIRMHHIYGFCHWRYLSEPTRVLHTSNISTSIDGTNLSYKF
jgi:hypothetical protein